MSGPPAFFDGLSPDEVAQILDRLGARHFPAGAAVIAEGDVLAELYVIRAGHADVFLTDRAGVRHLVNRVGPGATLGEMSLFTGQPASASVIASADLDVVVLGQGEFERALERFPRLYRNLGAILSHRLVRSERRALERDRGAPVVLSDRGAPPLLGYALACSVAWHTRRPTALLRFAGGAVPPEVEAVGAEVPAGSGPWPPTFLPSAAGPPRARMIVAGASEGPGGAAALVEVLRQTHDYVFLQVPEGASPALGQVHSVALAGPGAVPPGPAGTAGTTLIGWAAPGRRHGPDAAGLLHVPAPDPADVEALRAGVLPTATPTGRAVGWLARRLAGLNVGLALGAGSVKGYAHVGVLRYLERAGIPLDYLSGTSVGAAVGFLAATGHGADGCVEILDRVASSLFRLTLPVKSLLSSASLRAALRSVGGTDRLEQLRLPLAVVAADILSGREVVLDRGPAWRAVLASISVPGIYPPVRIGAHMLVDGGVLNPVPSNVAAGMGAHTVIAVKLGGRPDVSGEAGGGAVPSVFQAIVRSIEIMQGKIAVDAASAATILIEPALGRVTGLGLRDFRQGRRYIEQGEAAAEAALPRLAAAFPWLRG